MKASLKELKQSVIQTIVNKARNVAEERPEQALAYLQLADAANEVRLARRALRHVNRQNHENAVQRHENEVSHGRCGLEGRLLANPAQALAEAQSTSRGRRQLREIWESLGKVLLEKNGLNDQEYQLACSCLGAPNLHLRTSRARLDFDRALNEDRNRKFEVIDDRVERYMAVYLGRMGDEMIRNYCLQGDVEAAMIDTFLHRYKDWVLYLHHNLQEEEQFYYDWKNRPPVGRKFWESTRRFIAQILVKLRSQERAERGEQKKVKPEIVLTPQEMKLADNARRAVNGALGNYQKAVSAGKTVGLFADAGARRKM